MGVRLAVFLIVFMVASGSAFAAEVSDDAGADFLGVTSGSFRDFYPKEKVVAWDNLNNGSYSGLKGVAELDGHVGFIQQEKLRSIGVFSAYGKDFCAEKGASKFILSNYHTENTFNLNGALLVYIETDLVCLR